MASEPDHGSRPTPSPTDLLAATASTSQRPSEADATASDAACGDADDESDRIGELDRRVTELEAELDAVRGLLGGIEAVDEAVERRASIALAKAEALEDAFGAEQNGLVRERLSDTETATATEQPSREHPSAEQPSPEHSQTEKPASTTPPAGRVQSRDGRLPSQSDERSQTAPSAANGSDSDGAAGLGARLRDALR
ncbi:MAG: hypothetical protein ABEI27_11365 [Halobellus sp.]|uniref:DUF7310 family coiled-coil domain-containing protein n=1 Tax=Halobellus sp. TaxID=1979212 RepID=UPI0035D42AE7